MLNYFARIWDVTNSEVHVPFLQRAEGVWFVSYASFCFSGLKTALSWLARVILKSERTCASAATFARPASETADSATAAESLAPSPDFSA